MIGEDELPTLAVERAQLLVDTMMSEATGGDRDEETYRRLRREYTAHPEYRNLLPSFVRRHRNLESFWQFIKTAAPTYQERRDIIRRAFIPLMDRLDEVGDGAPIDGVASDVLTTFDTAGVHRAWAKALERRATDPDGAVTMARTLLETVIKHLLEEAGRTYDDRDDLPKLYRNVAELLNLAPSQHVEEPIKAILGGSMSVANGIGTLRNRFSDSHGHGRKRPVKPLARHATLAVNMAGTLATFLVETYAERA